MAITEDGGFGPVDDDDVCSAELLVAAGDRAAVTRALRRAEARLMNVLNDGQEVADPTDPVYPENDLYTVSYVSHPEQLLSGVYLWVDDDGDGLEPAMGAAFRRIVIEELTREGVGEARLLMPDEAEVDEQEHSLFTLAGVQAVRLERSVDFDAVLGDLRAALPEESWLLADWEYAKPDALERFGSTHPLDYLTGWPAVPLDRAVEMLYAGRQFNIEPTPAWVVHGEHVLALLLKTSVLARADLAPALDASPDIFSRG